MDKPELHLLNPSGMSERELLDSLADLYRALTGRDPTPEELEEAALEFSKAGKSPPGPS